MTANIYYVRNYDTHFAGIISFNSTALEVGSIITTFDREAMALEEVESLSLTGDVDQTPEGNFFTLQLLIWKISNLQKNMQT